MALIENITPVMHFMKMLAECQMFVFNNTLKKVSRCVVNILTHLSASFPAAIFRLIHILYPLMQFAINSQQEGMGVEQQNKEGVDTGP